MQWILPQASTYCCCTSTSGICVLLLHILLWQYTPSLVLRRTQEHRQSTTDLDRTIISKVTPPSTQANLWWAMAGLSHGPTKHQVTCCPPTYKHQVMSSADYQQLLLDKFITMYCFSCCSSICKSMLCCLSRCNTSVKHPTTRNAISTYAMQ